MTSAWYRRSRVVVIRVT